jgi:hypothetical protein
MLITHKRAIARVLLTASALVTLAGGAGCSGSDAAGDGGDSRPGAAGSGPGYQQALDYAKCMRENGLPDYPDPEQGGDGRVVIAPGNSEGDPKTKAAQEACRDKMPQGVARDMRGGKVETAKVTAWAKCIRDNGVPKFPDPEVEGSQIKINLGALGMKPDDPKLQKASAACQDRSPGGALIFEDGQ